MRHTGTQTIATERLTLRRFTIEDAENMYYNWASDPEVTRYLTWQPHKSVEETAEILQQWEAGYSKNEFYQWAIELNDIEQPIGSISVVSLNEDVQSAELGYCIGKSWWHQGYTTEAVEAVIRFLMAEVGAGRVWSQHDVANPNSGEVMKKAGMDYEGTLRQSLKDNQGIVDSAIYAKISHVALDEEPEDFEVTGPNILTSLPSVLSISYSEMAYALEKSLVKIDAAIMKVLEMIPPELYADIAKKGVYLAGGGALLKGLDRRLYEKTNIPFHVADDPLRAVARGTGIALKNIGRFSFLMK